MFLRGGNLVGIRLGDGTTIENPDGAPLTFLVEDERGEHHELYMTVGKMGTYAMFAQPPYRIVASEEEAVTRKQTAEEIEARESGTQAIPVAVGPRHKKTSV